MKPYPWFNITVFLFGKGLTLSLMNVVFYSDRQPRKIYLAIYYWKTNYEGKPLIEWGTK